MGAAEKYYTVQELADISKISTRTLHYYDERGLLNPARKENNYRQYGSSEVDRLQQILLYRELEMSLSDIKQLLDDPLFDEVKALKTHLQGLKVKQARIQRLIKSVEKTINAKERKSEMSDSEKFEAFKNDLINTNEQKYGEEIREKYGEEAVEASNEKIMNLSEKNYQAMQDTAAEIITLLHQAMQGGDAASADAQRACDLHRQWLNYTWKEGTYSKEAHLGLAELYVSDERFTQYYDKEVPGTAAFLKAALEIYCRS